MVSPPLVGGDEGEGETWKLFMFTVFSTPTLTLPHQGGGIYRVIGKARKGEGERLFRISSLPLTVPTEAAYPDHKASGFHTLLP